MHTELNKRTVVRAYKVGFVKSYAEAGAIFGVGEAILTESIGSIEQRAASKESLQGIDLAL